MASNASTELLRLTLDSFKSMSDEEAISLFNASFPDELSRLQHAKPSVETADEAPAGHLTADNLTPSRLLFGVDYPEINRTFVSLLALRWILVGDYARFTGRQAEATVLTRDSFAEIQALVTRTIHDADTLRAIIVDTVLNDIGKDSALADKVTREGGNLAPGSNHDEVVYAAANANMLGLLDFLTPDLKIDLLLGLQMGSKLNIPQLAQAENVPGSLRHVLIMAGHERAFELKFLEVLLDVAGAAAQVDARGANVMTEPVYQGLAVARKALVQVIRGQQSVREAYDQVLRYRGDVLQRTGFTSLSVARPRDRTLLRILAMGRVATKQKALLYNTAFDSLPADIQQRLCDGMTVDGNDNTNKAILPYYAPALFAEATRAARNSSDEVLVEVLASLMRFLARIYAECGPRDDERGDVVERDLYFVHDTIMSPGFLADPRVLDALDVSFL